MGRGQSLCLDGEIVRVTYPSGGYINIHKTALVDNAPNVEILSHADGSLHANLNASFCAVSAFARWLYTATMPELLDGESDEDLRLAFEAHALGRVIRSVDFMDATLDFLISCLVVNGNYLDIGDVLNGFRTEFPKDSAGRKLAVDFAFHNRSLGCDLASNSTYELLGSVQDEDIVAAIAKKVIPVIGLQVAGKPTTHDVNKTLISGFFQIGRDMDNLDKERAPWMEDKCQYHRHTELGLPCYTESEK